MLKRCKVKFSLFLDSQHKMNTNLDSFKGQIISELVKLEK